MSDISHGDLVECKLDAESIVLFVMDFAAIPHLSFTEDTLQDRTRESIILDTWALRPLDERFLFGFNGWLAGQGMYIKLDFDEAQFIEILIEANMIWEEQDGTRTKH